MYFYNQDGTKINVSETVVHNENVKDIAIPIVVKEISNTVPESKETPSSNRTIATKSNLAKTNQHFNQKKAINPIINKENEIEFQNSTDVAIKNLPKIETRNEIIISNFNKEPKELLLENEEKKLNSDKSPKIKVNAKSLLSQVDSELEFTFREKIFNKAVKNYKEVKVAIANRNQEQ